MNRNIDDEIRLLALGLGQDETLPNDICPKCGGGYDKEKSFSISRIDSGLLYNCFRATCHFGGLIPETSRRVSNNSTMSNNTIKHAPTGGDEPKRTGGHKRNKRNPFPYSTVNLSAENHAFLSNKFGFTKEEFDNAHIRWCPDTQSFIIPIFDVHGFKVGVIDRSWSGRTIKAINHWNTPADKRTNLYWPNPVEDVSGPLVVVEDFASAIKVARYRPAVAILGSSFGEKEAVQMREVTDTVVFALDNDATGQAIKLRDKYKLLFNKIIVMALDKDPHSMSSRELKRCFDKRLELD